MTVITKEITLYHAKWCGHCVRFLPTWKKFIEQLDKHKVDIQKKYNINIKAVDFEDTENENVMKEKDITSFPTIRIKEDENEEVGYENDRNIKSIIRSIIPDISEEDVTNWFPDKSDDVEKQSESENENNKIEGKLEANLEAKLSKFIKQIKQNGGTLLPEHKESINFYKYLKYKTKYGSVQ